METKYYLSLVLLCALAVPAVSEARHRNSIDTSDLDKNIVEEFKLPVILGIEYADINPDFGTPRGGGTREHEGQDFLAPRGTPIVSPTEAIVLGTGVWSGGGNYVQTVNPGGERFRYMHLDQIADIKRGDTLAVGDVIGTVGDTGNAGAGVYHLHFEVLDENGEPQDPHPRLSLEPWSAEEQADSLKNGMNNMDDEDEWAKLLVETFATELYALQAAGERLPDELEDLLEDSPVTDVVELLAKLDTLIRSIPSFIPTELTVGDSGTGVSLLQTYVTYVSDGPAAARLKANGLTSYYGPLTRAAVEELQNETGVPVTGEFDGDTKARWSQDF